MIKGKISPQQALKTLEKYFKEDLTGIYSEIDKFREGKRSLEVYTEQLSSQQSTSLTMFH